MATMIDPEQSHDEPARWLCSHLVKLFRDEAPRAAETALLEDIGEERAGLAVGSVYPAGGQLTIRAPGFQARVLIIECTRRETDFHLETRFLEGFRWTPGRWRPDHLFRVPARQGKANKAAGGG